MATIAEALDIARRHHAQGQLAEAEGIYRQILAADPDNAAASHLLGVIAQQVGRHDLAVALISKALAVAPTADACNDLGNAQKDLGRFDEAVGAYDRALAIRPQFPEALYNRGIALQKLGRMDEAIAGYERAIALKPDFHLARINLGNALQDSGRYEPAVACFRAVIKERPDFAMAFANLGNALRELNSVDEAVASYRKAVALAPDYAEAHSYLGLMLRDLGQGEEALAQCHEAVALKPGSAAMHINLGHVEQWAGRLDDAIASYRRAVALEPDNGGYHLNLGLALLGAGRFKEGFDECEWRWEKRYRRKPAGFARPLWDGVADLTGKSILVWGEQGVGDELLWSAFVPEIAERAGRCIVECTPKLVPLLTRSFPTAEVRCADAASDATPTDFDCHIPMGSLFRVLGAVEPRRAAFLRPDPDRVAFWRRRLEALGPGPFVGVAWTSATASTQTGTYARIEDWAPAFTTYGVVFVNLQYQVRPADLDEVKIRFGAAVHTFDDLDLFDDLDDVAALAAALDLVVSVMTAVATIASGVGTPTWRLTWRQSANNNILYALPGPSAAYFHRDTGDTWASAFADVAERLRALRDKGGRD